MLIECSSGYFPNLAINCQNKCALLWLVVIKAHFDSVKSYDKSIQHDELNHPVALCNGFVMRLEIAMII